MHDAKAVAGKNKMLKGFVGLLTAIVIFVLAAMFGVSFTAGLML